MKGFRNFSSETWNSYGAVYTYDQSGIDREKEKSTKKCEELLAKINDKELVASLIENLTINFFNVTDGESGDSYIRVDGTNYATDLGYGRDGVDVFANFLIDRIKNGVKQNDNT